MAQGITVDQASVNRTVSALKHIKNGAARALTRSLNTGATKTKTLSSKMIRENVRLPARYVSDRLTVKRATFERLESRIRTPTRGILMTHYLVQSASQPLSRYNATWGQMVTTEPTGDIKTRIKPKGPVHVWRQDGPGGVFLMRFANGQLGLLKRENGKLKTLYAPSLSQVFNTLKDEIIDPDAADIVQAELDRQIVLLLDSAP